MKKTRSAPRAPRTAKAVPAAPVFSPLSVSFSLSVKESGLEPLLGAAYLMTDRAYVLLSGDRAKTLIVRLRPKNQGGKKGLEALAQAFTAELAGQKLRWTIAKSNQPVREYLAEQAVVLAQNPPAPAAAEPPVDQLTDAQRLEIEKLISEVEDEIKTMNAKKAPAAQDPKNIKASWEEKQARPVEPGKER
jgi:His-Xaa-Ser system protein HxsD